MTHEDQKKFNQHVHDGFAADVTRYTFDPEEHFRRVLLQQGRVTLDADWNEQVSILLHYVQTLAHDLIGAHGGPTREREGFKVTIVDGDPIDFTVQRGRYYVKGLLCENEADVKYYSQLEYPITNSDEDKEYHPKFPFLVYLDVWERPIHYIQAPHIRELALGGPDTAIRSKVTWQIKVENLDDSHSWTNQEIIDNWKGFVLGEWGDSGELLSGDGDRARGWQPANRGLLQVLANPSEDDFATLCEMNADARYTGTENHLYRVEIHDPGSADKATFKWSRENASVVFAIASPTLLISESGKLQLTIQLNAAEQGRLNQLQPELQAGDWVELIDDDVILLRKSEPLWQVEAVYASECQVLLTRPGSREDTTLDELNHPFLRRWDQKNKTQADFDGAIKVQEVPEDAQIWTFPLENGIKIQFAEASPNSTPHYYRTGDHWLIPARTVTGDVEWPKAADNITPVACPPHGIQHYYAPLAVVQGTSTNDIIECRRQFCALAKVPNASGWHESCEAIGTDMQWPDD